MDTSQRVREQELISRFRSGDKASFDALVTDNSQKLFRVAFGLLGNKQDAEEVVQDAFVRAYKSLDAFRGDASFETWMHRITVNLARNKFKWNRRRGDGLNVSLSGSQDENDGNGQRLDVVSELADGAPGPDRKLENFEFEQNVMNGMNVLPPNLREAMILRHVDDRSYEEIADLLGCKEGTVKSRLSRGREMLRNYIEGLDE